MKTYGYFNDNNPTVISVGKTSSVNEEFTSQLQHSFHNFFLFSRLALAKVLVSRINVSKATVSFGLAMPSNEMQVFFLLLATDRIYLVEMKLSNEDFEHAKPFSHKA